MREYDDIRRLIEEHTQNPYESEALNEVVGLLAEGPLEASARDDYREALRLRLVAEAGQLNKVFHRPWFRRPLAMSAAAAVVVALAAGATALRLQGRRAGSPSAAPSQVAQQGASSSDVAAKSLATQEPTLGIAAVPAPSGGAAYGPNTPSSGAAANRGLVRPAQRDSAKVRVTPDATTFRLEATLPALGAELSAYRMKQVVPTASDLKTVADKLALRGEVQQGYGHLWVGEPTAGGPAPGADLPPYKVPGRWLVASPDWGKGWTYSYRNDGPAGTAPEGGLSQADIKEAAQAFLHQVGLVRADGTTGARLAVRPGERGGYWVDVNLVLDGRDVRDAGGALRFDDAGRIVYASWPVLNVNRAGSRPAVSAEEALTTLGSMPFDWYSGEPKLTITAVALVYRWPLLTEPGGEADVTPAYEFTVHDADGNQSVLYVSAWR